MRSVLLLFQFSLLVIIGCNKPINDQPPELLYSSYTLRLEGETYMYSDEEIQYDFCSDISTRNIITSKYYSDDITVYDVLLSPLNTVNRPKIFSYVFYVFWNPQTLDDLSLLEAFRELSTDNISRRGLLEFIIRDENNISFTNTKVSNSVPSLIDQDAKITMSTIVPDVNCSIYGDSVGEITYSYEGFIYNRDLSDSMYVDNFELTLYIPLTL